MLVIDWILLVLWILGAIIGWRRGCMNQVVSFAAFFVGLFLAKAFYQTLGESLSPNLNGNTTLANVIAFVLIWLVVPVAMSLAAELISKILDHVFLLGKLNKLFGALVGFIKYEVILGSVIWVLAMARILSPELMNQSLLCGPLKLVPEVIYTVLIDDHGGEE